MMSRAPAGLVLGALLLSSCGGAPPAVADLAGYTCPGVCDQPGCCDPACATLVDEAASESPCANPGISCKVTLVDPPRGSFTLTCNSQNTVIGYPGLFDLSFVAPDLAMSIDDAATSDGGTATDLSAAVDSSPSPPIDASPRSDAHAGG